MTRSTLPLRILIGLLLVAQGAMASLLPVDAAPPLPANPTGVHAQDAPSVFDPVPRPAYIYSGSCGDLGEVQWPLNSLVSPDGTRGGTGDGDRTEYAFTANVPISISTMLGGEFAINIHESGDNFEQSISCGNVTGVADSVGTLVVGLREVDGNGISGIVVLSPSPGDASMTYASIFITGEALGDEIGTIGVEAPVVIDPVETDPVIDSPPVNPDPPVGDDDDDDGGDDDDGDDD